LTGLPGRREITDGELSLALREPLSGIVGAIFAVLEQASPEIIDDISRSGICLAGGGSLLTDLPQIISEATGIACYRANDPLHCVVRGVGRIVDDLRTYKRLVFAE
jgi:rod shape-determining protein MreB